MKFLLAMLITLTSMSCFALTADRAVALVKASRSGTISNVETIKESESVVKVNFEINGGVICSATVEESMNEDGLKSYKVTEGFCFQ